MNVTIKKIVVVTFSVLSVIVLLIIGLAWYLVYSPNVSCPSDCDFYVRQGSDVGDVIDDLSSRKMFVNDNKIVLATIFLGFGDDYNVRPGHYSVRDGMRNIDIFRMLYHGWQTPVRLTINNLRLPEDFASSVSRQMMVDSIEIMRFLNDSSSMDSLGFTSWNLFSHIHADTYECWWNASVAEIMAKLVSENRLFWTAERVNKAESIGLSPAEVCILASIVDEESHYAPELQRIAGLYLNRLRSGMPLQSDPTVKFAERDFAKTRILASDLLTDSPYNTYKFKGLPPGPIRLPNTSTIDAVLNAETHKYIYMCADPSFNGSHRFAVTLSEHNRNASAYHKALAKLNKN
ncbi:MAG: endolytic transglycosylase MltG [Paludibacteraceae bacterium]|nr:endolytic transglycosylase MltG [Paludibacteraceae bacterium]